VGFHERHDANREQRFTAQLEKRRAQQAIVVFGVVFGVGDAEDFASRLLEDFDRDSNTDANEFVRLGCLRCYLRRW
jgi:hypothetical protein